MRIANKWTQAQICIGGPAHGSPALAERNPTKSEIIVFIDKSETVFNNTSVENNKVGKARKNKGIFLNCQYDKNPLSQYSDCIYEYTEGISQWHQLCDRPKQSSDSLKEQISVDWQYRR